MLSDEWKAEVILHHGDRRIAVRFEKRAEGHKSQKTTQIYG